ncbi:MAG: hypothetical protein H6659_14595 [Ardenticatenaceae bacterium]|nr:hypothetical protein [Ardenticatenaceae bacterium]MCB8988920.1 hypothetical protein [Ardenticatenaceae bacterium]
MLTLEIHDKTLAGQISKLLAQDFENNPEKMLEELIRHYMRQQERLQYSGILTWETDGLAYQKVIRNEWQ